MFVPPLPQFLPDSFHFPSPLNFMFPFYSFISLLTTMKNNIKQRRQKRVKTKQKAHKINMEFFLFVLANCSWAQELLVYPVTLHFEELTISFATR